MPGHARPTTLDQTRESVATVQQQLVNRQVVATINAAGGLSLGRVTLTASATVSPRMVYHVFGDTTAGAVTASLPRTTEYPNAEMAFTRIAGTNVFTVAAASGETVALATGSRSHDEPVSSFPSRGTTGAPSGRCGALVAVGG